MIKGFTLIELLVVGAIIAILAAISIPNLLEAQTRVKVSRSKAELRTISTALEAYRVDWNKPPPHPLPGIRSLQGTPFGQIDEQGFGGTGTLTYAISTPIAYLTTFMFFDRFAKTDPAIRIDERLYTYHACQWKWRQIDPPSAATLCDKATESGGNDLIPGYAWRDLYGEWRLMSIGPDRTYYNGGAGGPLPWPVGLPYEPTNGTVSVGNIIRSQKYSDQQRWETGTTVTRCN